MLDPCEVASRKSNLDIDNPNDGCIHGCTKCFKPSHFSVISECLGMENANSQKEDCNRTVYAIHHPTLNSNPTKKHVLWTLLIYARKLQKRANGIRKNKLSTIDSQDIEYFLVNRKRDSDISYQGKTPKYPQLVRYFPRYPYPYVVRNYMNSPEVNRIL